MRGHKSACWLSAYLVANSKRFHSDERPFAGHEEGIFTWLLEDRRLSGGLGTSLIQANLSVKMSSALSHPAV